MKKEQELVDVEELMIQPLSDEDLESVEAGNNSSNVSTACCSTTKNACCSPTG